MNFTEFYQKELEAELLILDRKRKFIIPASILLRGMFACFFLFIWAIFTALIIDLKPDSNGNMFVPVFKIFLTILLFGIFTIISVFSAKQLIKRYPKELSTKGKQVFLGFGIFIALTGIDLLCATIITSNIHGTDDLNIGKIIVLFFIFGIGGGVLLYNLIKIENKFKLKFKKQIISKIIQFTFPGSSYQPDKAISEYIFYESKLFSRYPYMRYKGSDFTSIVKDGTTMDLSYLDVSTQSTSHSGSSSSNNYSRTVFDGLFIKMANKKNNPGEIRVYTYSRATIAAEKIGSTILGVFGGSRSKLIKTGDTDFDKTFLVYTGNPEELSIGLNTEKMNHIMDMYNRTKLKFSLSFLNNDVFFAVNQPQNVFDPPIFSGFVSIEKMKKYCDSLEDICYYSILTQ